MARMTAVVHALGAEVTGVCRTRNVELVRSLGAKRVVDYTHEDVATLGELRRDARPGRQPP
jgi:NADPH:quinone reductase-like Zn-dependent oxidoreductase